MPSHQGALDGLCGPYSIVNALELCGLGKERETFFREACSVRSSQAWPRPVWLGTNYTDLKRMVRACLSSSANRLSIRARYPFARHAAMSHSDYWETFDRAFSNPAAVCAIAGLKKPSAHWVVLVPDGRRLLFVDSCAARPVYRKNRATLWAGLRRPLRRQWLLDRRELVVFERQR